MSKNLENLSGILSNKKIAVVISDGFEQAEFEGPVAALREAGATVDVLAQTREQLTNGIQGMKHLDRGRKVSADLLILDVSPEDYDALLIPGGATSADQMRESGPHLAFVRNFMDAEKPVAVICHGGWLLADAGVLQGRTLTSWPAIRKDLERAGAVWKDREVIQDGNLVTSRNPDDVPAFSRAFISCIARQTSARAAA